MLTLTPIVISRLCLGADRQPTSERTKADYTMLDTSRIVTIQQIRDLRLNDMGKILDVTHRGMTFRLDEASRYDEWSKQVMENLLQLEVVQRGIRALGGALNVISLYFFLI